MLDRCFRFSISVLSFVVLLALLEATAFAQATDLSVKDNTGLKNHGEERDGCLGSQGSIRYARLAKGIED